MFQCFFIKSCMCGLVWDIEGENRAAGTHIIMYKKKDDYLENKNQLFYVESNTHSIRSALTDMCLTVNGYSELVVEPFNGSNGQKWGLDGNKIRNWSDHQVADIARRNHNNGAKLCKWPEHGGSNQQFDFEYVTMFQYFFIKSRMSGLVWDIEGESRDAGTHIIMYEKKDDYSETMNQLFYVDSHTHTVRSALTDMCLSVNGDAELVVEPFNGSNGQEWELDGDKIRNRSDHQVADIAGENHDNGAKLCKWSEHGGINQQFDFEYVEPRYFFIRSAMHGKVVDVEAADAAPGAHAIMWSQNDGETDNQLWFATGNNIIRSKLNGFALDCCDGDMKLFPYNEHSSTQGFRKDGDHITSHHDSRCLDISGEDPEDGAKMCSYDYHDGANQRWEFQYI